MSAITDVIFKEGLVLDGILDEETRFYIGLGKIKQVINPSSNKYSWEIQDAVKSVRDGYGDFIVSRNMLFNTSIYLMVYKVDDSLPELKEKLRNKTIEGFKNDFL